MRIIELSRWILYLTLFLESITDIRKKQIWIGFPMFASFMGVWCAIRNRTWFVWEFVLELGIIVVFGIISKVSKEALGMGDVWVIGSILLVLGAMDGIGVLFLAFLFSAIYGGVMWCFKKKGKDSAFPLVPFLLLAALGGVTLG